MADPRYYQVGLAQSNVSTARIVANQILHGCAEPPVEAGLEASLSLDTMMTIAGLSIWRVEARLACVAEQLSSLATRVSDPNVSWFASQVRSRFGSEMRVGSDPDHRGTSVTWLSLSFDGPTGRERDEQPRVEAWLAALADAQLLPAHVSPRRLAEEFFAATTLRPGDEPSRNGRLALDCGGVRLRVHGHRADAGSPRHYGPTGIEVGVSVPPGDGFERAAALWRDDEIVAFSGFFDCDAATAVLWADAGVSRFRLDVADTDPGCVEMVLDAMADTDPAVVRWYCGWPDGGRYLNGLVLYANADGGPDDEPLSAPGQATLHLSVSPRVNDRNPDDFAARLASQAGVVLAT